MNKKTILLSLAGCTALAMAGTAVFKANVSNSIKADTTPVARSIRFDNALDVVTEAGSKIGLEAREDRSSYATLYENEKVCDMDSYAIIHVMSRDTNSLAVFENVTSIDISYKAPGTSSDALNIWLGKESVGNFSRDLSDYAYLPGTEGLYSTYTYTPKDNRGQNVLIALFSNTNGIEIGWMQINYTC